MNAVSLSPERDQNLEPEAGTQSSNSDSYETTAARWVKRRRNDSLILCLSPCRSPFHHLLLLRKRIGASGHKCSRPVDSVHYHKTLNASKVSGLSWIPGPWKTTKPSTCQKAPPCSEICQNFQHFAEQPGETCPVRARTEPRDRLSPTPSESEFGARRGEKTFTVPHNSAEPARSVPGDSDSGQKLAPAPTAATLLPLSLSGRTSTPYGPASVATIVTVSLPCDPVGLSTSKHDLAARRKNGHHKIDAALLDINPGDLSCLQVDPVAVSLSRRNLSCGGGMFTSRTRGCSCAKPVIGSARITLRA